MSLLNALLEKFQSKATVQIFLLFIYSKNESHLEGPVNKVNKCLIKY